MRGSDIVAGVRAFGGLCLIVILTGLVGCDSGSSQGGSDQGAQPTPVATPTEEAGTDGSTSAQTSTGETDSAGRGGDTDSDTDGRDDPQGAPVGEEIKLIGVYLRPGVQTNQHYVQVEETLAGPNPCQTDSLLIELDNANLALQWQPQDRIEIYGQYLIDSGGCHVVLNLPEHSLRNLPALTPEDGPDSTEGAGDAATGQRPIVRALVTPSVIGERSATFFVDRVIEGDVDCAQVTVVLDDVQSRVTFNSQYELEGVFDLNEACQISLSDPLLGLRPLVPTPGAPATSSTGPGFGQPGQTLPFFISGGVSFVDPIPIFSGAVGFDLTPEWGGMLSVGMGSGQIETELPSGEPIPVNLRAIMVEVTGLYNISGPFHVGLSGGLIFLSGDFDLPYPISGSSAFSVAVPFVGVSAAYDFGLAMATLSAGIALGGSK